jgi:outer membrane protein assembly factor BamB
MRPRAGRRPLTTWTWFVVVIVLSTVVGLGGASRAGGDALPLHALARSGTPPEVRGAANAWPLPDHDYYNSRDAGFSPIQASTVSRLTRAWSVPLSFGASTSPIVVAGVAYVQDQTGTVYAVEVSSGRVKWKTRALGFSIGPYGVSIGWGKLFAATPTGVAAFDLSDGTPLWSREITTTPGQGVDIQTLAYGGRVYVASVPVAIGKIYTGGSVGYLEALDANTGKIDWSFDTVRSKNLWGNPAVNSGGGAWYPPAIDTRRGIVYWGVANPAPFVGTTQYPNGSSRPGANLYTDSLVALSATTGKLLWYHQAFPHDLYDRDQVQAMLVPVRRAVDGSHQVVISAGKGGYVLGLNPLNGHRLWKTAVGIHRSGDLPELTGPTTILPGTYGGVLTPPASADGLVYAATLNAPSTLAPDQTAYFGGKVGTMDGDVVAMSARTGKIAWDTKVPGDPTGGVTIVNNLVLTATYQGKVLALNRSTGAVVWSYNGPGLVNGWMSVVGSGIYVPVGSPAQLVALKLAPAPAGDRESNVR